MASSTNQQVGTRRQTWPVTAVPLGPDGEPQPVESWSTQLETQIAWGYATRNGRIVALYEQGKRSQWNASTDVDWSIAVEWGAPVGETSSRARVEFERSELGRHGPELWHAFQWEFQSWMVSQFLHGEQGALLGCAQLAQCHPDLEAKLYSVNQAADEARHIEVFTRYLVEHVPEPYPVADALQLLLRESISDARWDVVALGIQIILEGVALAAFQLGNSTFHDPLIRSITKLVIRDEARHVSFGTIALKDVYRDLTIAERRDRETFVLHAAELFLRRFMLPEVWQRLGVDESVGVEVARTTPMMVQYRQAVFSKVVGSLMRVGLLTPSVVSGFEALGLIGGVGRVASGREQPSA